MGMMLNLKFKLLIIFGKRRRWIGLGKGTQGTYTVSFIFLFRTRAYRLKKFRPGTVARPVLWEAQVGGSFESRSLSDWAHESAVCYDRATALQPAQRDLISKQKRKEKKLKEEQMYGYTKWFKVNKLF